MLSIYLTTYNYDTGMYIFCTYRGICSSDDKVCERLKDFFIPFAKAYREICQEQINQTNCKRKEFYGLRDFYR